MKKVLVAVAVLALAITAAASATAKPWYLHAKPHGGYVCNRNQHGALGSFESKSACKAAIPDDQPSDPTPAGWPGTSGTLSGTASGGCNGEPIILTSQDDENGYGAIDFDVAPGTTFDEVGLTFDFSVLEGSQAQSEPYLIIRFTDGTQAFVYSVDVNPGEPGDQVYSLTGNTYVTREQAMEAWGDKVVSSATLAVDNGDLTISVNGVSNDDCPAPVAGPRTPDSVFLCPSAAGSVGVWAKDQAAELVTEGYFEPTAILGAVEGANNIGAYTLVCSTQLAPSGSFVGDGGSVYGADYNSDANHTAIEQLGFYPIAG